MGPNFFCYDAFCFYYAFNNKMSYVKLGILSKCDVYIITPNLSCGVFKPLVVE